VLRDLEFVAVPQVGQAGYRIDIGVRHPELPGRFVLGVECDGAAYHSSKVARDRDRLRQGVLEGLGWRLHRIWGPAWYRNRAGETARLKAAVDAAVRGDAPPQRGVEPSKPVEVELTPMDLDAPPTWATPYIPTRTTFRNTTEAIDATSSAAALREIIVDIVRQEGPISVDLCQQRTREAWGGVRNSAKVRSALETIITSLKRQKQLESTRDGFLYIGEPQLQVVRHAVAGTPTSVRKAADISSAEMGNALRGILREAGSAEADELTNRVSRLFGWARRGPDIATALDKALRSLVRQKLVERGPDGRYRLADPPA